MKYKKIIHRCIKLKAKCLAAALTSPVREMWGLLEHRARSGQVRSIGAQGEKWRSEAYWSTWEEVGPTEAHGRKWGLLRHITHGAGSEAYWGTWRRKGGPTAAHDRKWGLLGHRAGIWEVGFLRCRGGSGTYHVTAWRGMRPTCVRGARIQNQQGLAMLPSVTEVSIAKCSLRYTIMLS